MTTVHSLTINEQPVLTGNDAEPLPCRMGKPNPLLGFCVQSWWHLYSSVLLTYAITGQIVNLRNLAVFRHNRFLSRTDFPWRFGELSLSTQEKDATGFSPASAPSSFFTP